LSKEKPYRENVGVVVFNARGEVLAGERLNYPGAFQYPQGGLDPGEEAETGALRELYEEIGLKLKTEPLAVIPGAGPEDWLYYDFPADVPKPLRKYQGQKQKWFYYYWDGNPEELSLDHHEREFSRLIWTSPDRLAREIVAFKRPIYERLRDEFEKIFADFSRDS